MNERQKELFLMLSSENRWFSKEEICYILYQYYPRYAEETSKQNSSAFRNLRRDIREINMGDIEQIIISSDIGYKLATKEDIDVYLKRKLKTALRELKLYWNLKSKQEKDGQLKTNGEFFKTFLLEEINDISSK